MRAEAVVAVPDSFNANIELGVGARWIQSDQRAESLQQLAVMIGPVESTDLRKWRVVGLEERTPWGSTEWGCFICIGLFSGIAKRR